MFEVSLNSSWPKDSPRMDRSGFPEPAGPEIRKNRKNVFNLYFLHPKKIVINYCIQYFATVLIARMYKSNKKSVWAMQFDAIKVKSYG